MKYFHRMDLPRMKHHEWADTAPVLASRNVYSNCIRSLLFYQYTHFRFFYYSPAALLSRTIHRFSKLEVRWLRLRQHNGLFHLLLCIWFHDGLQKWILWLGLKWVSALNDQEQRSLLDTLAGDTARYWRLFLLQRKIAMIAKNVCFLMLVRV